MLFYDFEVFRYNWMVVIADSEKHNFFLIFDDVDKLKAFYEKHKNDIWVGYNSRNYDQYILKGLLLDLDPYEINSHIIQANQPGWSYSNDFNRIQLYNFDVMSDVTKGLKQLEGYMGNNIKESNVPFWIDRCLKDDEIIETSIYCKNDVEQLIEVFLQRIEEFNSHMSLIKAFNLNIKYINKTKPQLSAIILGASKKKHNDEFEISIPNTLKLDKYKYVEDWYKNRINLDYNKSLTTEIAGVPHILAWGGIHGAREKYHGEGIYINCDVASLYPSLMIEYGYNSRNISDPAKYKEIRDTRLILKKAKDPMNNAYKLVLNSTYGAMKDKFNNLYDPLMANNVCVAGQLLLLDLIEKIEDHCELIQSNTDGLFLKVNSISDIEKIKTIAAEWEQRTRLNLEWDTFSKIYQKDVNNYIVIHEDGSYKSTGAYLKKLNNLDNDLSIVNKALINYFIKKIPVETTINNCNELKQFQMIAKTTSKYLYAMYGDEKLESKTLRVFASKDPNDKGVFKVKALGAKPEKISNTPMRCYIENGDINGKRLSRKLDKQWYIDLAKQRIEDFGVSGQIKMEG
jgi:hypothetical protein